MTKRVAWFTGKASSGAVTPYKVYDVFNEDGDSFNLKDDTDDTIFCCKQGCAHICHKDWVFADVDEEETIKREGVVALLPEDSKFKIGQEVEVVDSGFYKGLAIIKGFDYRDYPYGYILETSENVDASPYHNGLCKDGYALWVREGGIKAKKIEKCVEVSLEEVGTVKRKGVMTLLPEDSKFEIGQRVRVDRSGYIGYTTIIGYNYDYDEYATECDKDNDCSHDCDGLAKEKGKGLWVAESDIIESVEAKQPKWSKWIKNTTGKCPEGLKRKQKIKLKWSDGDKFVIDNPYDAAWYFSQGDNPVDITHYKVKLKEAEKPKSKWTKNTGVCPVNGNIAVMMKFSDGTVDKAQAQEYSWDFGQIRKITKWRLAD